jgi:putative resolvase
MDDEYINTPQARALLNITTQTIRRWADEDKIKYIRTPKGTRRYSKSDIYRILGRDLVVKKKQKIIYCRVSSKKQSDDLNRQIDYLRSLYPNYELVTDIGSGINWKRQGFKTILEQSMSGNVEEIVVAHGDRLCRFAIELVEWILSKNGTKLTILDREEGKSSEQELAEDLLSIVHIYSCRNMGKRRYKSKEDKDVSNSDPDEDLEQLDGNIKESIQ